MNSCLDPTGDRFGTGLSVRVARFHDARNHGGPSAPQRGPLYRIAKNRVKAAVRCSVCDIPPMAGLLLDT
jgi:hypothetical protein